MSSSVVSVTDQNLTWANTEQIVEFNVEQAQKSNGFLECVLYPGDPELYFNVWRYFTLTGVNVKTQQPPYGHVGAMYL